MATIERHCPACGAADRALTPYGRGEWRVVACLSCGFAYLGEAPGYDALQAEHEWSASFKAESERRRQDQPVSRYLDERTRFRTKLLGKKSPLAFLKRDLASGRILDVGCGNGSYFAGAGFEAFTLHGVELSPVLAGEADAFFRARGGGVVCDNALRGLSSFSDRFFEAVVMRSYLEHELQPRLVLQETLRVLRPGGFVVVKVPNFGSLNRRVMGRRWCGFRFPDHLNYFTPGSLRRMAEGVGFSFECRPTDRLPTSDNLWAVLRRPTIAARAA